MVVLRVDMDLGLSRFDGVYNGTSEIAVTITSSDVPDQSFTVNGTVRVNIVNGRISFIVDGQVFDGGDSPVIVALVILGEGTRVAISQSWGSNCDEGKCSWDLGGGRLKFSAAGTIQIGEEDGWGQRWRSWKMPTVFWELPLWDPVLNNDC